MGTYELKNKDKLSAEEERYRFIVNYLAEQYDEGKGNIPTEIDKRYIQEIINEITGKEQYSKLLDRIFAETGILNNPVTKGNNLLTRIKNFQIRHSRDKYELLSLII